MTGKNNHPFLIEIAVETLEHAAAINAVLRDAEENGTLEFPFSVKEAISAEGIYRWTAPFLKEVK